MARIAVALATALAAGGIGACAPAGALRPDGPVAFDTATAWVIQGTDSASVLVEIARTEAEQSLGLAERSSLDPGSGMLFLFSGERTTDDGFWMWRTWMPLDVAYIDRDGRITQVGTMEPCDDQTAEQDCPGYFPDASYASALEVNAGWFEERGFGPGATVRIVR
jgi:uncharacterized membrane protein (UPF0127 family)